MFVISIIFLSILILSGLCVINQSIDGSEFFLGIIIIILALIPLIQICLHH
jgi:hypothetical protein